MSCGFYDGRRNRVLPLTEVFFLVLSAAAVLFGFLCSSFADSQILFLFARIVFNAAFPLFRFCSLSFLFLILYLLLCMGFFESGLMVCFIHSFFLSFFSHALYRSLSPLPVWKWLSCIAIDIISFPMMCVCSADLFNGRRFLPGRILFCFLLMAIFCALDYFCIHPFITEMI